MQHLICTSIFLASLALGIAAVHHHRDLADLDPKSAKEGELQYANPSAKPEASYVKEVEVDADGISLLQVKEAQILINTNLEDESTGTAGQPKRYAFGFGTSGLDGEFVFSSQGTYFESKSYILYKDPTGKWKIVEIAKKAQVLGNGPYDANAWTTCNVLMSTSCGDFSEWLPDSQGTWGARSSSGVVRTHMCPFTPQEKEDQHGKCLGTNQPEGDGGCNSQCWALGCKYYEAKHGGCTGCDAAANCGTTPSPTASPTQEQAMWCQSGVMNKNGKTCCSASCGTCGGKGCGGRPGGASQCCVTKITSTCTSTTQSACNAP
jgi:hypothetical protein